VCIRRPETADIVCIGDSMTYGVVVPARESWPVDLAKLTGETVYNMGLGGYGPIQYLYLLQNLAVKLRPKTVIVGFYFGNDLFDVYNMVRSNKRWSKYQNVETANLGQGGELIYPRGPGKFLGDLRDWLSRNSVLYVLVTQHSTFDFIRQRELTARGASSDLIRYRDEKHQVTFNLGIRFVNLRDPRLQSAMQMTGHIISDIQSVAEKSGMRLIIALIPTKERVYGKLIQQAGYREKYPRLADTLDQEDRARIWMINLLRQLRIETVDLLPALEAGVSDRDLYPLTDPHPNKYGTRLIAQAIDDYLKVRPSSDSVAAQNETERARN
jgi:SGNH hydrolase-like domain, acetyltransferase AlgX